MWVTQKDIDRIKRESGVYVLYTSGKKLKYIGYSKNLFDRLLRHHISWSYAKMNYMNVGKAKELEYRLIKKLKPILNDQHNRKILKAEHRIRLLPETYYTLKMTSDLTKVRIADLIDDLIEDSEKEWFKSGKRLAKQMIEEIYENKSTY